MNPIIDRELKLIPLAAHGVVICECKDEEVKAYKDRNDEVVVECQKCLAFLKFPKGTV